MDITPYLDLKPAPCAVFEALAERRGMATGPESDLLPG